MSQEQQEQDPNLSHDHAATLLVKMGKIDILWNINMRSIFSSFERLEIRNGSEGFPDHASLVFYVRLRPVPS